MDISTAVDLVRDALLLAMVISAPMLLIGLVVGVIVSILQAVTQIQEQTLTFVPKIAAMITAAILLMPWIGQRLLEYAASVFSGGMHQFCLTSMSVAELLNFVPIFALVLFRLAGLMMFAPLFGSSRIPRAVKVLLALVLAMFITPTIDTSRVQLPDTVWGLSVGIGCEMAFGLALGTVVSFVFIAAQWAGEIIGQQMGLNISEVLDPQYGQAGSLVGDLYFMLTMMVFLSPVVRGHAALIEGVSQSFHALPLMSVGVDRSLLDTIVGLMQSCGALALQLAAPMLMTMLIVDLALGCIGKAMPQMNVMAMGLSLRSVVGMLVLILGLELTTSLLGTVHGTLGDLMMSLWNGL